MAWGFSTSFYFKNGKDTEINAILARNQNIYESRSHFIRAAVERLLRVETAILHLESQERAAERSRLLKVEVIRHEPNRNKKAGERSNHDGSKQRNRH